MRSSLRWALVASVLAPLTNLCHARGCFPWPRLREDRASVVGERIRAKLLGRQLLTVPSRQQLAFARLWFGKRWMDLLGDRGATVRRVRPYQLNATQSVLVRSPM